MIISLVKLTLIGLSRDKEQVLSELQEVGCLHVVPLRASEEMQKTDAASSESGEALKFLLNCPYSRRQVHDPSGFDAATVERRALDLKRAIHKLTDERDFLKKRIRDLRPWGDFTFPDLQEVRNLQLWFYIVPNHLKKKVDALNLVYDIVGQDNRFSYIVVVAREEPQGMPVPRTHTGNKSLSELEQRLEDVELELEDLQAERISLTRWCWLFARDLHQLEDRAVRLLVSQQTLDQDSFFALQAWAPRDKLQVLENFALDRSLVFEVTEPEPDEVPPTLLQNKPLLSSGQDLVSFYMTPGYWLWDPSAIVFFSFAFFFRNHPGRCGLWDTFRYCSRSDLAPYGSLAAGTPFAHAICRSGCIDDRLWGVIGELLWYRTEQRLFLIPLADPPIGQLLGHDAVDHSAGQRPPDPGKYCLRLAPSPFDGSIGVGRLGRFICRRNNGMAGFIRNRSSISHDERRLYCYGVGGMCGALFYHY